MRLRDQSHNRSSAKCQHDECPNCREHLAFETDGMGRVFCYCPHCRDGRPHSRAKYLARLAEEDAAWRTPEMRRCAWCDTPFTPATPGQRYCGASCREANHNQCKRERTRRIQEGVAIPKRLAVVERPTHCVVCGKSLDPRPIGTPKRYCGIACRSRFYRSVHASPVDPSSRRSAAMRRYWQQKRTVMENSA